MKVILPVAGYGTRLKPHTDHTQKALLPVAGKPVLDHIIDNLADHGIDQITFIIGHLGDQIVQHMEKYSGAFTYVNQTERLGLGHAVLQGLEDRDEPVLVHLGDAVYRFAFSELTDLQTNGIVVLPVDDPARFGVIALDKNKITGFFEKVTNPPTNLAIIGLYYFPNEARLKQAIEYLIDNDIRTKGEYQITDAMEVMLGWGEQFVALQNAEWFDAGIPASYLETNRKLLESSHDSSPGVEYREPVFVGNDCRIENSIIGPNVTIMPGSSIKDSVIENCIVLDNSDLNKIQIKDRIVAGDGSEFC